MIVDILQFLLPGGRKHPQHTEVSDDCRPGYEAMQKCGCRLTAEVLRTGMVSCTIEEPNLGDVDISLSGNGPQVQQGLERMLKEFTVEKFETWKKERE